MPTESRSIAFCYRISGLLSRFFGESTQEWAEKKVDGYNGEEIQEMTLQELMYGDSIEVPEKAVVAEVDKDEIFLVFKGDRVERGRWALAFALQYRLRQYGLLLLISALGVGLIHFWSPIRLQSLGLYLDMVGAGIVARGIFRIPVEVDRQGYKEGVNFSPIGKARDKLIKAAETIDGILGTLFLTIGFLIQFSVGEGVPAGIILAGALVVAWSFLN